MTIFELEDIENILQQHGKIRQAVVQSKLDPQGIQRLVGYIVTDGPFESDEIIEFLKKKLPIHRIPSIWVEMDRLPLSLNGDINKKALPELNTRFASLPVETFGEGLAYWKEKLRDTAPLRMPTDFQRQAVKSSRVANLSFSLDPALSDQIRTLGEKHNATMFMTLLAAFKVLLYRYTGHGDLCIGSPTAGKDKQDTKNQLIYINKTLALRTQIKDSMDFVQVLQAVRATSLEAYQFSHVPLEDVVVALGLELGIGRNPLFEIIFALKNPPKSQWGLGDPTPSEPKYSQPKATFDLSFELTETWDGIQGNIEYCTHLYTQETILRMAEHYRRLLQAIVEETKTRISLLPLLHPNEKNLLLGDFSLSQIAYPKQKTIVDLFEEQAALSPDAVAVVFEGKQLTYRELNEKANQLANYLRSQGVQEETLVPICVERSMEMIIGIIAIMKAGAAYVPVDPEYPQERIKYIFADTRAERVLTNKSSLEKLEGTKGISTIKLDEISLEDQSILNPDTGLLPNHLVYVIYTSGSTGKPKGVMIEHGQLMDHCYGMIESANLSICSSFALTFPLVFDAGHSIIHSSIVLGATLHVMSDELILDGEKLAHYLTDREVDCMKIVPSLWQSYAEEQQFALSKKVMVFGGEPFPPVILSQIGKTEFSGEVYNHYGPTETTIGKCIYRVDYKKFHHIVPIGRPYSNSRIYIVDRHHQLVPLGVAGEICISGVGVGRGYHNQPELSAEKFITDPFSQTEGTRMYLTGDLARWNLDGNIECLGRIDDQVKIRGFRIELGEIETAIQQHGQVRRAAVVAKDDKKGNKRLVGYLLADGDINKKEIIGFLKERLPEFMVPSFLEVVDRLPLTFNGKINKKALPEVDINTRQQNFQSPLTAHEKQLAEIWQSLLGIEKIGIHDDFFELGGHSLLAMRAVASVRKSMERELSIRDLFASPTIKQLAESLEKQGSVAQAAFMTSPRPDRVPLSYNQQSLWLIHKLEGSIQYHLPIVLKISGILDVTALSTALQTIVNRHEVLRTVIREEDGQGFQTVMPPDEWRLEVAYVQERDSQDWEALIVRTVQPPFDLAEDHMLRACLFSLPNTEHLLVIALHHIASDGWSSNLMKRELVALYGAYSRGGKIPLDLLPIQYSDFALYQRARLQNGALRDGLIYWKEKLRDTEPLQMPTDFPRPSVKSSRGATCRFSIDPFVSDPIRTLGKKQNATMFMTLLATFKVLLYRYTGQEDLCVGTPTAGRERQETEHLLGYFVNTLAMRTQVKGTMVFSQLLQAVRDTALEAFEFREVPFEKVVETLGLDRDISRNPLFETMFVLQNQPRSEWELGDLTLSETPYSQPTATFDLTFELTETNEGILGKIEYCTDIYRQETIQRMAGHYSQILQAIGANPETQIGQLNFLPADEEKLLVHSFNPGPIMPPMEQTIVNLFEQKVLDSPNTVAVIFGEEKLTYQGLNGKANQLAHYLRNLGVKKEWMVPICLDGSLEMIIGIVGILKAGAAYVPIDPAYPKERIDYVLEDTGAAVVLTNEGSKQLLVHSPATIIIDLDGDWGVIARESSQNLTNCPAPNDLAYVIYTSGSTGKPKGVMIEHKGLATSTQARQAFYQEQGSVLLIPSFAFDSSVAIIFGSLATGGKLIVCRSESIKNPEHIKILLKDMGIILCVPSYYRFLLDEELLEGSALSKVILAGEKLDESLVRLHYKNFKNVPLFNEYGPTEGTVWATVGKMTENEKVTIGKPVENTSVYIVGKEGNINPIGVPGELCIAGNGLARGYLNLGKLTEEKFIPNRLNPVVGPKMYRTGDLARWLPNGHIEYLGRLDDQVKIRGYRIELGEIEAALKGLDGIKDAAVMVRENSVGNIYLAGFLVMDGSLHLEPSKWVGEKLGEFLPDYMIPETWAWIDALPLTHNGKVDRKALSKLQPKSAAGKVFLEPKNQMELQMVLIWKNMLQLDRISTDDDFFVLGGHSLLAVRVIAAIRKQMGVEIGIKALFSFPSIVRLATHLSSLEPTPAWVALEKTISRPDQIPLSYNQESLWFIDQLEGSTQYHLPIILRLNGELDEKALSKALLNIMERHEVLRTVVVNSEGEPWQKVMDFRNWTLQIEGEELFPDELKKRIESIIARPFDLSEDFMLRAMLIRINRLENVLVMVMHHIASDGWSIPILLNELQILYEAVIAQKTPELLPLPIQYADYALWQRNHMKGEAYNRKLDYWKEKLKNIKPLQLPVDYFKPVKAFKNGAIHKFLINRPLKDQIFSLSKQEGSTLFMTLLTAFKVLLYHFCQEEEICVGTASAGRQQQETEGLIGYFINPLPIRTLVDKEDRFSRLLKIVKANTLEAFENQEVPFEKMVEAISLKRELGKNPLFQVMFVLQNVPETSTSQLGPLQISQEKTHSSTSKFELTFNLSETIKGIEGTVEYNTDLFGEKTISYLAENYMQLLTSIVSLPGQKVKELNLSTEKNYGNYPEQDFSPGSDFPEFKPVHRLIEDAAQKFGAKPAIFCEDSQCTYAQLNQRANQLAHFLIKEGILPGDVVGILMDRSMEMIVAVLGTLKAGGAYLPIDTDYPEGRVEYMLKDAAKMHITSKNYQGKFTSVSQEIIWEDFVQSEKLYSETNPLIPLDPTGAAYIIYTSGSTGRPKGVVIEHRQLFNFLVTSSRSPGIAQGDRFLAVSSVSFDIAILEMLLPYVHGAQCFILDKYQRKDPSKILEVIESESISLMFATPTHWKMILDSGWEKPLDHLSIISGGEALTEEVAERLLPLCRSLWNIYGPTETTVFSTIKQVKKSGEAITIGRPVLNTNIYILDDNRNPVKIGTEGEIFISGHGVARQYLNQPELTAEKFLHDPFHPAGNRRMYMTGDRGKYLPNGEILILGRKDHQVKLRGYRIELGEVEHALNLLDQVKESIAGVKEIGGQRRLIGYLVLSTNKFNRLNQGKLKDSPVQAFQPTLEQVKLWKRQLSISLPSFMVPDDFVVMDNFPHTASGKTDRRNLPPPAGRTLDTEGICHQPETREENIVSKIWREALGISSLSITDNFFEIGGHSLIAVQVMTRLENESGIKLPLSILFKYPTVQKLASVMRSKEPRNQEWDSLVSIKPHGNKPPFYIVHGGGLNVLPFYSIAKNMDPEQPVFGLQAKGLNGTDKPLTSIEEIAAHYVSEIISHNPQGPYTLAGYSLGGIIAFEMAKQLKSAGRTVKDLIMFDTYASRAEERKSQNGGGFEQLRYRANKRIFDFHILWKHPLVLIRLKREALLRKISGVLIKLKIKKKKPETPIMQVIKKVENIQKEAGKKYILTYYDGPIYLLRAKIPTIYVVDQKHLGWKSLAKEVRIRYMDGEHTTMFSPPNDVSFAQVLQEILDSKNPQNMELDK